VPLSSESNGCAKYRPSAASPAVLSAGGDVHGSMPKIFAVLPTALSALSRPGHAFGLVFVKDRRPDAAQIDLSEGAARCAERHQQQRCDDNWFRDLHFSCPCAAG